MADTPASSAGSNPLVGVAWMVVTGFLFVGVTAIVKYVGDDIPAAQSAFLRYLVGLVFLIPLVPSMMRLRLSRRAWGLLSLRGIVHSLGVALWFFAMARLPMAEVTAMNYLTPIYVALGAALFLGERLKARRLVAIVVALVGAIIILRPGFREVMPGHLAMLVAAFVFAVSYLIVKRLAAEVPAGMMVAMLSVLVTLCLAPFAYAVWVPPTVGQVGWLFVVAGLATAGHYTMTLAIGAAPMAVTQPVTFLQLLWATLVGVFFFAEPVDAAVIAGGGLIMASVSFISWREAVLRRRNRIPAMEQTKL
jgi:drug/metabolite transporter (DMT)-like permease